MIDLADAVGMLIRQQSKRVHFLPGRPEAHYAVRAPSLLVQLADAVASSSGGRGGRTVPGSRAPVAVDALDLWHDIHVGVHGWARQLGVDRRPFVAQARARAAEIERLPEWQRTLRPWLRPVAWDEDLAVVVAEEPAVVPPPAAQERRYAPTGVGTDQPPVGRLLRVTAAAAVSKGDPELIRTLTRRCACGRDVAPADCRTGCWAHRIQGMLAAIVEDREIRGASCWECRTETVDQATGTKILMPTTTVLQDRGLKQEGRHEDLFRVPAIVVRVAVLPDAGPDDLWIYRMCRACGAEGWLDYTTSTSGARLLDGSRRSTA